MPKETASDIHDGRKIFFKSTSNISQRKDTGLFGKFPTISSVSLLSNGKTLDTTFWLNNPPIINGYFQNSSRASNVHQVFVYLEILPSQDKTLNVAKEENIIKKNIMI